MADVKAEITIDLQGGVAFEGMLFVAPHLEALVKMSDQEEPMKITAGDQTLVHQDAINYARNHGAGLHDILYVDQDLAVRAVFRKLCIKEGLISR